MSMDDAAFVVLNALTESRASTDYIEGTGIELPMGMNGFIAPMHPGPMHPGMDLENVQMTPPPAPVHAASPDSGVSPGDIIESLSGRITDESA